MLLFWKLHAHIPRGLSAILAMNIWTSMPEKPILGIFDAKP